MDHKPETKRDLNEEDTMISLNQDLSLHVSMGDNSMHVDSGSRMGRHEGRVAAAPCHVAPLPAPDVLNGMKLLPHDFRPSNYSVICGRGRGNYNACGNRRFRVIVGYFLDQYIKADGSAVERGFIFNKVMAIMKEACPVGSFIKEVDGRFYELSERAAREKCSTTFRDCLMAYNRTTAKMHIPVAIKKLDVEDEMKKQAASPAPSMITSSGAASEILPPVDPEESDTRQRSDTGGESVASSVGSFFDVDTKEAVSIDDVMIDETGADDENTGGVADKDLQWYM